MIIQRYITPYLQTAWSYLLCLIAGALLTLGFSPFEQHWLGIVSPAILFACWYYATPARAFLQGWLFGVGLFGSGASWVYVSIATYGNINPILAGLLTLLFALILALGIAVNGWLNVKCYRALLQNNTILKWAAFVLIYPTTWVLFEWLRSWLFSGFPWLYIGYTQMHWPLAWYAPIGSVYLISWLTLITATVLLMLFFNVIASQIRWIMINLSYGVMIVAIWLGGWALSNVNWTKPMGTPLPVALIQGNIPQTIKWDKNRLTHIIEVYTTLTQANWRSIIIWPENALPSFQEDLPNYLPSLSHAASIQDSAILIGMPIYHKTNQHYFNGAVVKGQGHGTYLKRHLVPFGEYIPFYHWVGRIFQLMDLPMSNFSAGPNNQSLLVMHGYPVALFICYESAFPQTVRRYFNDAAWLTTISDDAWFGHSIGPLQHQQIAAMRALELGRYELRATNNGVTSIINAKGNVIAQAPRFQRAVLSGEVVPMHGKTPWAIMGLWPWLILWFALLGVLLILRQSPRHLLRFTLSLLRKWLISIYTQLKKCIEKRDR